MTQTPDFHTEGAYGLRVDVIDRGTGSACRSPSRWTCRGRVEISFALRTGATGTSVALALQTGPAFTWCQSSFPFIGAATTTTVTVDLFTDFSCDPSVLADVRGLLIFFNPGSYEIDEVKAA